jgi:hypothetical protein
VCVWVCLGVCVAGFFDLCLISAPIAPGISDGCVSLEVTAARRCCFYHPPQRSCQITFPSGRHVIRSVCPSRLDSKGVHAWFLSSICNLYGRCMYGSCTWDSSSPCDGLVQKMKIRDLTLYRTDFETRHPIHRGLCNLHRVRGKARNWALLRSSKRRNLCDDGTHGSMD